MKICLYKHCFRSKDKKLPSCPSTSGSIDYDTDFYEL